MKEVDLIYRTLYAELAQRSLDASFEAAFPQSGNFLKIPVEGRDYWYFHDNNASPPRRYVGPVADAVDQTTDVVDNVVGGTGKVVEDVVGGLGQTLDGLTTPRNPNRGG